MSLTEHVLCTVDTRMAFSSTAMKILRDGKIIKSDESAEELIERVGQDAFRAECLYGTSEKELTAMKYDFSDYISKKLFILGSPALTNSGNCNRALGSCAAVPVDMSSPLNDILQVVETYYEQNMGSGFNLSNTHDPTRVIEQLNQHAIRKTIEGSYERYIGNMANIDVDHPKIRAFARLKSAKRGISHFNFSVNITDTFMDSLINERALTLKDGYNLNAADIWDDILYGAWKCGDPGLLFMDRFNADNPTPLVGAYTTTAPCAEVGLTPGESCVFGYINVSNFLNRSILPCHMTKSTYV